MAMFYETYEQVWFPPDRRKKFLTSVSVVDEDTFTLASTRPGACCLSFASHKRPGGGYKNVLEYKGPLNTQEEDLFRRSDLPQELDCPGTKWRYPLKGIQAFYSRNVRVNKDKHLNFIEPFQTSVITMPAVVRPETMEHLKLAEKKAKRILEIAAAQNHETLILGAWGCGIFKNDPYVIALFFRELLVEDFNGVFREVVFGVPGKETVNHRAFQSAFNGH